MYVSTRPKTEIWRNLGLPFATMQSLHQSNVYTKRNLGLWRAQKFIPLVGAKSALTCAGPQTTPSPVSQYRAENGNLEKFKSTYRHSAVFAPKQCLSQKEARAMKCPKMYSSSRFKQCTSLCGSANYPISSKAVQGRERKFGEIRSFISLWCSVCIKAMFIYQKEVRAMESPTMYSSSRCKKRTYLCGSANYPVSCESVQAENGNLGKFGRTYRHGAVFAPKQCLYQKEPRVMESPKMHSSRR